MCRKNHNIRVHPRIRGEDSQPPAAHSPQRGSPPHTRGRFSDKKWRRQASRFTPAYAGKIVPEKPTHSRRQVHPRIRGEDNQNVLANVKSMGSPPHTRGRSDLCLHFPDAHGFTPAYAGKICACRPTRLFSEVHPRIRGEDSPAEMRKLRRAGSPPHTRGR